MSFFIGRRKKMEDLKEKLGLPIHIYNEGITYDDVILALQQYKEETQDE